jgi:4-amino-4-deoxy-L-arabinose transferase-like glycosyltransferase
VERGVTSSRAATGSGTATWLLLAVTVLATLSLVGLLWTSPVHRTQEARVLVTAREMKDAGWQGWLIPTTNGHVRLRKPPLAYWATAASFKIFGVGSVQGRMPAALAGGATLLITFHCTAWLFGRTAALFAAASLLGCVGFFTYARQAETDVWAMLFVTAGVYTTWRGYTAVRTAAAGCDSPGQPAEVHPWLWFHASAIYIAMAALAKGPPAAYPLLFFAALVIRDRAWTPVRSWLTSGAWLTALVIAVPWFLYVFRHPMAGQLSHDLANSAVGGGGHGGSFLRYVPHLLGATAPWSGMVVLAMVAATQRCRCDHRLSGVMLWCGAILVPLCFWANKQPHYLLPLLPPVMVLAGWLLGQSASGAADAGLIVWVRGTWCASVIGPAMAVPAIVLWGRVNRGRVATVDVAAVACVCIAVAGAGRAFRLHGLKGALSAYAVAGCAVTIVLVGIWAPAADSATPRTIAAHIRGEFGPGPYVFYRGLGENLPLTWYLNGVVPRIESDAELAQMLARNPRLVIIQATSTRTEDSDEALELSGRRHVFEDEGHRFIVQSGASPATAANLKQRER